LNVQTEGQTAGEALVKSVDLASKRAKVSLNRPSGGHEVLENRSPSGFTEVLVVSVTAKLRVLGDELFLPR
jgi:hypothetical protein